MKRFKCILILSIIFTAYLFSQVEENEQITKEDTNALTVKECEQRGLYIISAGGGIGFLQNNLFTKLNIPISYEFAIIAKYAGIIHGSFESLTYNDRRTLCFGLGVEYTFKRTDYFISKISTYIALGKDKDKSDFSGYPDIEGKFGLGMGVEWDLLFGIKPLYISISPEFVAGSFRNFIGISLGLNIVF